MCSLHANAVSVGIWLQVRSQRLPFPDKIETSIAEPEGYSSSPYRQKLLTNSSCDTNNSNSRPLGVQSSSNDMAPPARNLDGRSRGPNALPNNRRRLHFDIVKESNPSKPKHPRIHFQPPRLKSAPNFPNFQYKYSALTPMDVCRRILIFNKDFLI